MFNESLALTPKAPEEEKVSPKPVLELVDRKKESQKDSSWTIERIKKCIIEANKFAESRGGKLTPNLFKNKEFNKIFKGAGRICNPDVFPKETREKIEQVVQEKNLGLSENEKIKFPRNIDDFIMLFFEKSDGEYQNFERRRNDWSIPRIKECVKIANKFAISRGEKLTPNTFQNKEFNEIFKSAPGIRDIKRFTKETKEQLEQLVQEKNRELSNDEKLKFPRNIKDLIVLLFGKESEEYKNFEQHERTVEEIKECIKAANKFAENKKEKLTPNTFKDEEFNEIFKRASSFLDVKTFKKETREQLKKIVWEKNIGLPEDKKIKFPKNMKDLIRLLFGEESEEYKNFEQKEDWTVGRMEKCIKAANEFAKSKKEKLTPSTFQNKEFNKIFRGAANIKRISPETKKELAQLVQEKNRELSDDEKLKFPNDIEDLVALLFGEESEEYKNFEQKEDWTVGRMEKCIKAANEFAKSKNKKLTPSIFQDGEFNKIFKGATKIRRVKTFSKKTRGQIEKIVYEKNQKLSGREKVKFPKDIEDLIVLLLGKESEEYKNFKKSINISKHQGFIFQYSLENVIKLIGNENLDVEPNYIDYGRPDLVCLKYEKSLIFDLKLQTTNRASIFEDKRKYSKLISEKFILEKHPNPEERKLYLQKKYAKNEPIGYLVFITLNGYNREKEEIEKIDQETGEKMKIGVKYYKGLDFIERIVRGNKKLLTFISGEDSVEQGLTKQEKQKIIEIKEVLEKFKYLIQKNIYSTKKDFSLEEADKKYEEVRERLHKLAKSEKDNKQEILETDFKGMFDL